MRDGIDGFVPRLGCVNSAHLPETRGSTSARMAEEQRIALLPRKLAAKARRQQKRRAKSQRREEERRARQMANTVTGQTTMAVAGTTAVVRKPRRRPTGKLTTEEYRLLRGISDRHVVQVLVDWWIGNGCWQRAKVRDRVWAATLLLRGHIGDSEKTATDPVMVDLRRLIDHFVQLDRVRVQPSPASEVSSPPPVSTPAPPSAAARPVLGGGTAPSPVATPSSADSVLVRLLEQQSQMQSQMMQSMQSQTQLLSHLAMTLGNVQSGTGPSALTTPARTVFGDPTIAEPPPPAEFKDMSEGRQRAILNSMHHRYAKVLKADGTEDGEQYKEAWNISYEYFERQTGIPIRDLASAESDSTGHRCRPLDIIFARGLQVRFYDIVRATWEH